MSGSHLIALTSLLVVVAGCSAVAPPPLSTPRAEPEPPVAAYAPVAPPDRSRSRTLLPLGSGPQNFGGYCRASPGGPLVCWGDHVHYAGLPHLVEGVSDVVELVRVGSGETCARRADGTVACVRQDVHREQHVLAVPIEGVIDLAVCSNEVCAVRESGHVSCWGGSWGGRAESWRSVSDDVLVGRDDWTRLTEREGIDDAIALRAAPDRGCWCALRRGGRVSCWGSCDVPGMDSGQTNVVQLEGLDSVTDLELLPVRRGEERPTACAVSPALGVICAGGREAELTPPLVVVRPRESARPDPPEGWGVIEGTTDIVELAWREPASQSCGRTTEGELRCWEGGHPNEDDDPVEVAERRLRYAEVSTEGGVRYYQDRLAQAREVQRSRRIPEELRGSVEELARSPLGGCASLLGGGVRCWGNAPSGRGRSDMTAIPARVEGLSEVTSVAAAESTTCAVHDGGQVSCWGRGEGTALGPERTDRGDLWLPHRVEELDGALEVFVSSGSVCARMREGAVRCRGYVTEGSSGSGGTVTVRSLRGAQSLALTARTLCGILRGRVLCHSVATRCVDDVREVVVRRLRIAGVEGAVQLAARDGHFSVLTGDGRSGTFYLRPGADDEPTVRWAPDAVERAQLANLNEGACTLADGTVSCWSAGADEQPAPVRVGALHGLSGGVHHMCGIDEGGRAVCWGWNALGEVGRMPIAQTLEPAPVEGLSGVRTMALGTAHTCAVDGEGALYCWGSARGGLLGVQRWGEPAPPIRAVPGVQ